MYPPPALAFGSCYSYSPSGACIAARRSRVLCARLKAGNVVFLEKFAGRIRFECAQGGQLAGLFDDDPTLVPVPASTPALDCARSAPGRLSAALLREGLGATVWPGLARISAVRKSATAQAGSRPTVGDHYQSFAVAGDRPATDRLLLVDDVVSRGRTLLAAAARLQEAFPKARIRAFALLRTMSLVAEIESLVQPCVGEIRWRRGDARRVP